MIYVRSAYYVIISTSWQTRRIFFFIYFSNNVKIDKFYVNELDLLLIRKNGKNIFMFILGK